MMGFVGCCKSVKDTVDAFFKSVQGKDRLIGEQKTRLESISGSIKCFEELCTANKPNLLILACTRDEIAQKINHSKAYVVIESAVKEFIKHCTLRSANDLTEPDHLTYCVRPFCS